MTQRESTDAIAAQMMREQWQAPSASGRKPARYRGARYIARRSCDAKVVRG